MRFCITVGRVSAIHYGFTGVTCECLVVVWDSLIVGALQVPGQFRRSNDREAGPALAAAQRNARELSRDEEAYFSEAAGSDLCGVLRFLSWALAQLHTHVRMRNAT